jgi:hypothetical protein
MEISPRGQNLIPVDIYTSSYRAVGKLEVSSAGVMGIMNDATSSFMEMHDARLARLHVPTKLVDHFEIIRMVRLQVFAICLTRREDIGPKSLVRGGYATVNNIPVRIITQVYELEGTLEMPGRFDFSVIMAEGTHDFIPLYNAKLTAVLIPKLMVKSPCMMFNRRQVDMIGLSSQRSGMDQERSIIA